jgi:3-oxoisoapionate kinase
MTNQLLIAYYGDDFTGSTDALEFLSRAGIRTVLFIEPPTKDQLQGYEGLQAIGVAGMTRSMVPEKMEEALRPAFEALRDLAPRHVHYKVCSTFDSSPKVGSIGKAIDVGFDVFDFEYVPLLVAAPALGRHCAFGNLFAKMGIGSNGEIFRLDRHPSMSKHPVTPADESDLRLHLSKQTDKKTGLIDILQVEQSFEENKESIESLVKDGNQVILFDAIYQSQMQAIGKLIDNASGDDKTVFSVGSSGIEMALGAHWKAEGIVNSQPDWNPIQDKGAILVVSGSCSPVSSAQIKYALKNGFKEIAIDTEKLASEGFSEEDAAIYIKQAAECLNNGFDVLVHTSLGNDDIRVSKTEEIFKQRGIAQTDTSLLYGTALGKIARGVAKQSDLKRIIIAGGDTSSYAARAMGIEAVEMIAPLSPGAPLCKAYAPYSAIDQLEVNFKGGQVGKEDYYIVAKGN